MCIYISILYFVTINVLLILNLLSLVLRFINFKCEQQIYLIEKLSHKTVLTIIIVIEFVVY